MTPADAEKWSDQVSLEEGKKYSSDFAVGSDKMGILQNNYNELGRDKSFIAARAE